MTASGNVPDTLASTITMKKVDARGGITTDNRGSGQLASQSFQSKLWGELAAAGLIPEPECHMATCIDAAHLGVAERDRLKATMGLPAWWCGMIASGLFSTAYGAQGILGWGYALTEFFIAPLPLNPAEREVVACLGTLANFIVTFYDTLLDSRGMDDDPLPRQLLESNTWQRAKPMRWTVLDATPRRVLTGLVKEFFYRMDTLPGGHQHTNIRQTIRRAILRMYDAERRTLRAKADWKRPDERALRIKSAYPFVIMGLCGWLLVPQIEPAAYRWHLRWLCRLGDFYGWIDDAVDLHEDTASARPNRIVSIMARADNNPSTAAELARRIAKQGKSILAEWHERVQDRTQVSPMATHVFSACLASWFGSLPVVH